MNFIINTKTGYAYDHVYLPLNQVNTFHAEESDSDTKVVVKDSSVTQNNYISPSVSTKIDDDWTDEEEQEWDVLLAQPHVQVGLSKLAQEAEQQFARGEFEEGGFAVE